MLFYISRKYKRLAKLTMLQILSDNKFLDGVSIMSMRNDKKGYILDECLYIAVLYAKAGQKKPFEHRKIPTIVNFKKLREVLSYYIDKELQYLLV